MKKKVIEINPATMPDCAVEDCTEFLEALLPVLEDAELNFEIKEDTIIVLAEDETELERAYKETEELLNNLFNEGW